MTMPTETGRTEPPPAELNAHLRNTLLDIERLDDVSSGYLSALAFILHRVAAADGHVCEDEVRQMENILVEHAAISPAQAILVVEIARHRRKLADCCCRYGISRELRPNLNESEREALLKFLDKVAEADGLVQRCEKAEIHQVATELGLLTGSQPGSLA